MFDALLSNKVPGLWMTAAYPSLKPLASWYKDLQMRMEFMHGWNKGGVPVSIALPYIFFTQGEHPPPRTPHHTAHHTPPRTPSLSLAATIHIWDSNHLHLRLQSHGRERLNPESRRDPEPISRSRQER